MIDIENQLIIKQSPGHLQVDVAAFRELLKKELADYEIVVTPETIDAAKTAMAELNKAKDALAARRKEVAERYGEPLAKFVEDMKQLELDVVEARTKIKTQVDNHVEKVLETIQVVLDELLVSTWDALGVEPEFRTANTEGLVLLGSMTAGGNVAKAAKDKIEERAKANRAFQDKIEKRILELEVISYRNGLKVPLTREYVEAFLFEDDDAKYSAGITRIIDVEKKRQEQTEAAITQEQAKTPPPEPAPQVETVQPVQQTVQASTEPTATAAPGMITFEVLAVFRFDAPETVTNEQIDELTRRKLEAAGMTNKLVNVVVNRFSQKAKAG